MLHARTPGNNNRIDPDTITIRVPHPPGMSSTSLVRAVIRIQQKKGTFGTRRSVNAIASRRFTDIVVAFTQRCQLAPEGTTIAKQLSDFLN